MALIDCPECKKETSDKAPTCPHCGYPIAGPPPVRLVAARPAPPPAPVVVRSGGGGGGGGCGGGFLLLLIAGVIAFFTKPTEPEMIKQVVVKKGAGFGIGAGLGEAFGAVKHSYNDYVVFTTLSQKNNLTGADKKLAIGVFGQVIVLD